MIISLEDAQKIDPNIDQDDLDSFENTVRELTNNNFQNTRIRYKNITFISHNSIGLGIKPIGLKVGDTIEINYNGYNNGLYAIKSIVEDVLGFEDNSFTEIDLKGAMLTKIEYPADVKRGIKKLIQYDKKMSSKVGIKSETISRMSTTYYDVNNTDNTEGYPSSLLSFLDKYKKMRW